MKKCKYELLANELGLFRNLNQNNSLRFDLGSQNYEISQKFGKDILLHLTLEHTCNISYRTRHLRSYQQKKGKINSTKYTAKECLKVQL